MSKLMFKFTLIACFFAFCTQLFAGLKIEDHELQDLSLMQALELLKDNGSLKDNKDSQSCPDSDPLEQVASDMGNFLNELSEVASTHAKLDDDKLD